MKQRVASLVVVLFFTCTIESRVPTISENHKLLLLNDVLTALEKVTEFFVEDYADVNMDGLFGVRLGQGGLIGAIDDCSGSGLSCPPELVDQIEYINDQLTDFGEKALPYIKQQNEGYYTEYLPTIIAPYIVKYIPEKLVGSLEDNDVSSVYDPQLGGDCFTYVMGTSIEKDKVSPACTVTDDCWQFGTHKGSLGYHTTHQLVFLIYLEHTGCEHVIKERLQQSNVTSLRDIQTHLCEMIYLDATARIRNLKMEPIAEDLFLEQIALCGALGFQNFFNEPWIRMAIGWQTASGCFTIESTLLIINAQRHKIEAEIENLLEQKQNVNLDQATQDEIKQKLSKLNQEYIKVDLLLEIEYFRVNVQQDTVPTRKLLTERVMQGNCLSHKTGLGVGALGVTVRSLVGELYGRKYHSVNSQ